MALNCKIALLLAAAVTIGVPPVYAQLGEGAMIETTNKGSLDIMLEQTWNADANATFKVTFLNPNTTQVHEHQDYDFRIKQGDNEIFSAARQVNQPLIHNAEGTIFVPYKFEQQGDFTIELYLAGTGIGPTLIPTEESALFPVHVTPEFPAGMIGMVAALVVGTTIALTRKLKFF